MTTQGSAGTPAVRTDSGWWRGLALFVLALLAFGIMWLQPWDSGDDETSTLAIDETSSTCPQEGCGSLDINVDVSGTVDLNVSGTIVVDHTGTVVVDHTGTVVVTQPSVPPTSCAECTTTTCESTTSTTQGGGTTSTSTSTSSSTSSTTSTVPSTTTSSPNHCPTVHIEVVGLGGGQFRMTSVENDSDGDQLSRLWSTGATGMSIVVEPHVTTTYTVWVTDGSCTRSASITFEVIPTTTTTSSTTTTCPACTTTTSSTTTTTVPCTTTTTSSTTTTTTTTTTTAPNQRPVADARGGGTFFIGDDGSPVQVHLDGSSSYDPDGNVVAWSWSGAGSSSASNPTFTLGRGIYSFCLSVRDDDGAWSNNSSCVTVIVKMQGGG
jgi:hypothetical protein